MLCARLAQAGVPEDEVLSYASNSLRKGGVSRAHAHGVPKDAIKRHGGWSSDAVNAYITHSHAQRMEVVSAIYKESSSDDDLD